MLLSFDFSQIFYICILIFCNSIFTLEIPAIEFFQIFMIFFKFQQFDNSIFTARIYGVISSSLKMLFLEFFQFF